MRVSPIPQGNNGRCHLAGFRDDHFQAAFTLRNGSLEEVFSANQETWDISRVAKSFRLEWPRFDTHQKVIQYWNTAISDFEKGQTKWGINRVVELQLEPGTCFKRMARTTFQHPNDEPSFVDPTPREKSEIARSESQLASFLDRLNAICRVIDPNMVGLTATGIEISQLLILTCIEIENQMRLVLQKNGYSKGRFDTSDFVKLLQPLHLDEWQLNFLRYPWLDIFAPFLGWDCTAPTKSLVWWLRYNQAKHNSDRINDQPTLNDVFDAIAAYASVLSSQFGVPTVLRKRYEIRQDLSLVSYPEFSEEEMYIPIHALQPALKRVDFPFNR